MPEPGAPNIVIVLSDDQSTRLFDRELMPRIFSELVDQGVNFTRAYVNVPLCCPSRASILTGLYAHHTGVDTNSGPLDRPELARPTFVQALYQAGYRTMLAGKYLNSESCDPKPGWDRWVCTKGGSQVDPNINIDGRGSKQKGFTTDILADYAIDFIERSRADRRPFVLLYAPKSPHLPANDPRARSLHRPLMPGPSYDAQPHPEQLPAWVKRPPLVAAAHQAARTSFEKMSQQMPPFDAAAGRVLDALGPEASNTLVVFLSDNGYLYGEHRLGNKGAPYEESVRVPFVIRYPKLLPSQNAFVSDALVSNVDLAATVMDIAGIPWDADGRSLRSILEDRGGAVRDALLLEWCQATGERCVEERANRGGPPPYWGIVSERHVLVQYSTGEEELYDLKVDPFQLNNLSGTAGVAATRQKLLKRLVELRSDPPRPETTLAVGPEHDAPSPPFTFLFFSQSLQTRFRCRLVGPAGDPGWTACDAGSIEESELQPGSYTFQVRAVDAEGLADQTPAERRFVVPD